jgi:hypothetical protein
VIGDNLLARKLQDFAQEISMCREAAIDHSPGLKPWAMMYNRFAVEEGLEPLDRGIGVREQGFFR